MSFHDTPPNGVFEVTLWSRVLRAGESDGPESRQALEELCQLYWYPIYAFLRRTGNDRQDARDLAQGFFHYLLQRRLVGQADPDRGRFRSFLIGILKNYVRDERNREQALRRGGGVEIVSIDEAIAEGRYAHEPVTIASPEKLLDRRWALEVLEQAKKRLEAEFAASGKARQFAVLRPYLTGEPVGGMADLATRLNRSEAAARTRLCRFREDFRHHLRSVIAATVSTPEQVDLELADLQAALREH